jgi:hypothetical protein
LVIKTDLNPYLNRFSRATGSILRKYFSWLEYSAGNADQECMGMADHYHDSKFMTNRIEEKYATGDQSGKDVPVNHRKIS